MKKQTLVVATLVLTAAALFNVSLRAANAAGRVNKWNVTLQNLQSAYNGEANAQARYVAFAAKADEEGYGEVASLLRALARAEEIHATNYADLIRKMGYKPVATVKAPLVRTTRENLARVATPRKNWAFYDLLPDYIRQAREDRNSKAVQVFEEARAADEAHLTFLKAALNNLEGLKGSNLRAYYVCTVCGYITDHPPAGPCPVCKSPDAKYEVVK